MLICLQYSVVKVTRAWRVVFFSCKPSDLTQILFCYISCCLLICPIQIMAWRPFYSWNSVMQFWHTTQEEDNTVLPNKVLRYMYLCSSIPNFPANINHGLQNAIKRKVLVQSVREEPSMQDGPAWEFASRTPPAGELQRHVPCSYKRRDPIIKAFHWMATT